MLIPSSLAGGLKPADFAISMWSAYNNDFTNTTGTTHPTLYGDCFGNLWWFGILLAIFWAVFIYGVDKVICRKDPLSTICLTVIWCSSFVMIGRGAVYNSVFVAVASSFVIGAIHLFRRVFLPIHTTSKTPFMSRYIIQGPEKTKIYSP